MSFSREKFPKSFKFPVKFQNLLFKPKTLIGLKSFFAKIFHEKFAETMEERIGKVCFLTIDSAILWGQRSAPIGRRALHIFLPFSFTFWRIKLHCTFSQLFYYTAKPKFKYEYVVALLQVLTQLKVSQQRRAKQLRLSGEAPQCANWEALWNGRSEKLSKCLRGVV